MILDTSYFQGLNFSYCNSLEDNALKIDELLILQIVPVEGLRIIFNLNKNWSHRNIVPHSCTKLIQGGGIFDTAALC